jgi:hypothetical protein
MLETSRAGSLLASNIGRVRLQSRKQTEGFFVPRNRQCRVHVILHAVVKDSLRIGFVYYAITTRRCPLNIRLYHLYVQRRTSAMRHDALPTPAARRASLLIAFAAANLGAMLP